jgi:hypothetical protein
VSVRSGPHMVVGGMASRWALPARSEPEPPPLRTPGIATEDDHRAPSWKRHHRGCTGRPPRPIIVAAPAHCLSSISVLFRAAGELLQVHASCDMVFERHVPIVLVVVTYGMHQCYFQPSKLTFFFICSSFLLQEAIRIKARILRCLLESIVHLYIKE